MKQEKKENLKQLIEEARRKENNVMMFCTQIGLTDMEDIFQVLGSNCGSFPILTN
jgi:hypothetical protein